ncbi:MAG: septum formation initiator family protein [Gemmatimonadaceae bacterium]|nr:septum formation initiator family protein [Gemmatimonadaceae bacterium]
MARGTTTEGARRSPLATVAKLALAAVVLLFAVEGGEYGTSDLLRVRRQIARTRSDIDSLRGVVDSLALRKRRLQGDVALQERIAREEFGMVQGDRELLYRFIPPDTATADSAARPPR